MSTVYTPLETLLLFQALRSEGVNSHSVFSRISDQIKGVPLVRNDPTYDHGRLSPDALRELYLGLLKEEVKRDLDREFERESLLQNGDVSPGSRKRKAPSPNLPTVHEASQHAHLIPQLVIRLYARYREHVIREIREHERRYDALTREIREIESGEWDQRLQRRATQSPAPSASTHTRLSVEKQDQTRPIRAKTSSPAPPAQPVERKAHAKPSKENTIDLLVNHEPEQPNGANGHRRSSSNMALPPLSEMAPQSPHLGIPPTISGPNPLHAHTQGSTYYPQPPFVPHHGHPAASPVMPNPLSRPTSSQFSLPPQSGMTLPPPSPQHTSNLRGPPVPQQYYSPQPSPYRLAGAAPLGNEQQILGYPPPQVQHHVSVYPQQQPWQPIGPNVSSTYPPLPPETARLLSAEELRHVQALEGKPKSRPGQQTWMPPQPATAAGRPSLGTRHPPSAPPTGARPIRPANTELVSDIINALATPPRAQRRPVVWRSERRSLPLKDVGTPLPTPNYEPLSPSLKRSEPAGRSTRSTRNRDVADTPSAEPEPLQKLTRGHGRPRRERSPLSVVSSTADESARMTRSHSVSTATGALLNLDDRPGSRGKIKVEPSTPAGLAEETDSVHDGGRLTRKRRGTLQAQPQQPPAKRMRQHSPFVEHGDEMELGTPPPRPTTVMATRNFHKLSGTIMNDINSHKHASYFANLVRDKDAPGYSEIIKQPQHLKSIRLAIAAGARAVNAATASMDSPSADSSATIELERNADLIPPKGIVNAAQLEKEVVRMFANAVMFNPGDDGMVRDTREMYEDIEAKIREWRGAEKESMENEDEEGKGKRRKL